MPDKEYDCRTCPYPRYKTPELIYCDVCIQRILDQYQEDKQKNKEQEESAK